MSLIIFILTSCFFSKAADQIHGFVGAKHMSTTECIPALWITYVSANRECWGWSSALQGLPSTLGAWLPPPEPWERTHIESVKETKVESLRTPHPCPFPQSISPALRSSAGASDITGLGQSWGGRSLTPGQFKDPLTRSVSPLEHDKGLGRVTSGTQFP